jgi:hypothetical protein
MAIDQAHLELALGVGRGRDEQTKREYNQAFFKKLYITAEWDNDQIETSVQVSGVELTEPYALLLTEGLFEQAEAEAIQAEPTTQNRTGSAANERTTSPVSIYEQMAGSEGRLSKHAPCGSALASCMAKGLDVARKVRLLRSPIWQAPRGGGNPFGFRWRTGPADRPSARDY